MRGILGEPPPSEVDPDLDCFPQLALLRDAKPFTNNSLHGLAGRAVVAVWGTLLCRLDALRAPVASTVGAGCAFQPMVMRVSSDLRLGGPGELKVKVNGISESLHDKLHTAPISRQIGLLSRQFYIDSRRFSMLSTRPHISTGFSTSASPVWA